jgi:hypothetical protein
MLLLQVSTFRSIFIHPPNFVCSNKITDVSENFISFYIITSDPDEILITDVAEEHASFFTVLDPEVTEITQIWKKTPVPLNEFHRLNIHNSLLRNEHFLMNTVIDD